MATTESLTRQPLEELMLSMDVVDTLRHQQELVDRELDGDARRERLIERLRDIYKAQGIEVTDRILAEGVRALEEERFVFKAPPASFATRAAELYATRQEWGRPFLLGLLGVSVVLLLYYVAVLRPDAVVRQELPAKLDTNFAQIVKISASREVTESARNLLQDARAAMQQDDYDQAVALERDMRNMLLELTRMYEVRIVSRPNQLSGVWRVPASNPDARNYYLIVEAVSASGKLEEVLVRNEEDGFSKTVTTWGIRVDEETFEAVAADKKDDGIIQDNLVGEKQRGYLQPNYLIRTTGASITEW